MAKYNFKIPNEKKEDVAQINNNCSVFGCPRIGTIVTVSRNCRYHHGRNADSLNNITMLLKNHEREINWYEKVLNMPFHEYDKFKDNAPRVMLHYDGEELIQYRARMAHYISELFKHPNRVIIQATKTHNDYISEIDF